MPPCKTRTSHNRDGRWKAKKGYETVQEAVVQAIKMDNLFNWYHFNAYQCQVCGLWHVGRSDQVQPIVTPAPRHDEAALLERGERALVDEERENHHPFNTREGFIIAKVKHAENLARWGDKRGRNHRKLHAAEYWITKFIRSAPHKGITIKTALIRPPKGNHVGLIEQR